MFNLTTIEYHVDNKTQKDGCIFGIFDLDNESASQIATFLN